MIRVNLIGSGKVAFHLIEKFHSLPVDLRVYARNPEKVIQKFADKIQAFPIAEIQDADITLLAVTDDAVEDVSSMLPIKGQLVVHMAGSRPIHVLSAKNRRGVLYPVQSFTETKSVDYSRITFCVETETAPDQELLENLVHLLGSTAVIMDSDQRLTLHLSAVLVNNFVNHLYFMASELCEKAGISFELLTPLIQETTQKILTMSAQEAQTGPAIRNDRQVLSNHLSALTDPVYHQLYQLFTESIQKKYGKKL